jgi:prolyl 4-hydroxylase
MIFFRSIYLFLTLVTSAFLSADGADYGVDCSFPIHSKDFQCGDLLGDRKAVYEEYMQGCREKWGEKGAARCDLSETDRLEMSRRQPQSMVVSSLYTSVLHSM